MQDHRIGGGGSVADANADFEKDVQERLFVCQETGLRKTVLRRCEVRTHPDPATVSFGVMVLGWPSGPNPGEIAPIMERAS